MIGSRYRIKGPSLDGRVKKRGPGRPKKWPVERLCTWCNLPFMAKRENEKTCSSLHGRLARERSIAELKSKSGPSWDRFVEGLALRDQRRRERK